MQMQASNKWDKKNNVWANKVGQTYPMWSILIPVRGHVTEERKPAAAAAAAAPGKPATDAGEEKMVSEERCGRRL